MMISTFRTSDFQISGSAISSHKNIQQESLLEQIMETETELEELKNDMMV